MAKCSAVVASKRRLMNQRETPPGANPAARWRRDWGYSGFDRIGALPVLALGGSDRQAHLLAQGAADEATDAVGLPTRSLHDCGKRGALRPFQQFEDLLRLAAFAGATRLFAALGRFLGRAGLLPGLALLGRGVRRTWRNTGLLGGFRLRTRR